MITTHETVEKILHDDEVALSALTSGFMNLSAYAKRVQKQVEKMAHKKVTFESIVMALSRIEKTLKKIHPLTVDVAINTVTTKSPLTEIVFEKTPELLGLLSQLYKKVQTKNEDFLTMTLSSNEVSVICSERLVDNVQKIFTSAPLLMQNNLASIGLSLHECYYDMPNITFTLIRKIAQKRIVLAETITTHTEIIFIFPNGYLAEMIGLFTPAH